ncbi:50s ribosomal protein l1 [Quercus suber]|uniref:50s ribosomal protein l1 n=1 Tax=Quercus suber TaxID=58331 RepID=A0AAW0K9A3_QUESU
MAKLSTFCYVLLLLVISCGEELVPMIEAKQCNKTWNCKGEDRCRADCQNQFKGEEMVLMTEAKQFKVEGVKKCEITWPCQGDDRCRKDCSSFYYLFQAISEFKQGKVEYRADKTGIVHLPFGKAVFPEEDLIVNLLAAVKSVESNKPSGAKGVYWKSAHICSSMGPSIRLNIREMLDYKPPSMV